MQAHGLHMLGARNVPATGVSPAKPAGFIEPICRWGMRGVGIRTPVTRISVGWTDMPPYSVGPIYRVTRWLDEKGLLVRELDLRKRHTEREGARRRRKKNRECAMCTGRGRMTNHHIIPWGLGGADETENLVTLGPNCHEMVEWRIQRMEREAIRQGIPVFHADYVGILLVCGIEIDK